MKAIWKGSIGFGLVSIPVKLYSATQDSSLDLDMVDKRDMARIRYQRVNENTGKEIKWEQIGKAYMYHDQYVLLEEEDFIEAAPEKSKMIAINQFIKDEEIDSIYYESSYYIEPDKGGERAYALLREALAKSGKVGIAQFVLRSTEALTVLKPMGNILVLSKIRFAQEIRSTKEFNLPSKSLVKPAELKMASTLINQYSGAFKIEKYKDEYSSSLLKVIRAKASGKKRKVHKFKTSVTKSENLMDQLKASLSKSKAS